MNTFLPNLISHGRMECKSLGNIKIAGVALVFFSKWKQENCKKNNMTQLGKVNFVNLVSNFSRNNRRVRDEVEGGCAKKEKQEFISILHSQIVAPAHFFTIVQ